MIHDNGKYWFEPKRYGLGTGLPVVWQGWAALGSYLLLVIGAAPLAERTLLGYLAMVVVATALFLVLCIAKTRGGWRWRWGEEPPPPSARRRRNRRERGG